MVKFGESLSEKTNSEFSGYYIDYTGLKKRIRELENLFLDNGTRLDLIHKKAEQFARELDFNINRAVIYYEEKLEENVNKLTSVRKKWRYLSPQTLPQIYEQVKDVARGIRECLAFVEINAEAVRKILNNAEKNLLETCSRRLDMSTNCGIGKGPRRLDSRTRSAISENEFLKSRLRPDSKSTSRLEALRVYCGLDCVVEELRRRCDAMRSLEAIWFEKGIIDAPYIRRVHSRSDTLDLLVDLHAAAQSTVKKTKWYYGWLAQAKIDYEREPVGEANKWGLFLNNYNTFLYLANYYAVIPTASEYAIAMGLSPMVSGLLLSMAPLSALFSSIFYSLWSNRSFKEPLLFCTLLLIIGNFLYSVALDYHSTAMLFVGRLLVGLGGNRAVNRRYIADFVCIENRTFHSALFVAAGSLGMCLGPGCQTLFNKMHFSVPYLGYQITPFTAPGWVMCVLWVLFAFQVLIFFSEPHRRRTEIQDNNHGLLQPLLVSNEGHNFDIFATLLDEDPHWVNRVASSREIGSGFEIANNNKRCLQESSLSSDDPVVPIDGEGTVLCLWIYFVLKLIQEAFQTVAPLFAAYAFNWTDESIGYLLAFIGVVVLPVNLVIGSIGGLVTDRLINVGALILLGAGAVLTVDWTTDTPVSVNQYIAGALILFVSAQTLEAVCMSLLSKVMPKVMSKGLWNSGFLSTEAGTFGRVIGASLITLAGSVSQLTGQLNPVELEAMVMIPSVALVILTLIFVFWKWDSLIPISDRLGKHMADEADDILKSDLWKRHPELRPLCVQLQSMTSNSQTQNDITASPPRRSRNSLFILGVGSTAPCSPRSRTCSMNTNSGCLN